MDPLPHSEQPIRWGVLGCGRIAHNFAQGLGLVHDGRLQAVASRTPGKAAAFAEAYQPDTELQPPIEIYTSYEELVQDPEIDAVYIATTHNFHYQNTRLCLEHGKHVLCEKPITLNARQLDTLIETARSRSCFLMEALWTRFLPGTRKLQQLLQEQIIGDVHLLHAVFGIHNNSDPSDRLLDPALAGGALLDLGVYPLHFAAIVFPGDLVDAASTAYIGRTGVDETSAYLLRFGDGAIATLASSCAVETPHDAILYGSRGHIIVENFFHPTRIHVIRDGHRHTHHTDYPYTGFQYEIAEACRCIRCGKGESPIMPLHESYRILRIMDQFRASWHLQYPGE